MKILVIGPENRYQLYRPPMADSLDAEAVFVPEDRPLSEAARANPDAEVLFCDPNVPIDAACIAALPRLRLIQSEGVAFNRFDLEAATRRGIYVCNNKGCNAASVAEHTVMLMLMALRCGVTGHNAVRAGRQYEMKQQVMAADAPELGTSTVGLVGFGDIGRATAERLLPFGCRLCYCSLHRRAPEMERQYRLTWLPLPELAAQCDILSLHCAVTEKTTHLIDGALLKRIRPGAILVNTARGALLDNMAVRQALVDGRLGAIAMDTLDPEPTPADHPLVDLPPEVRDRAIYSPHLGGNTGGAFRRAHGNMWNNVRLLLEGRRPQNIVNGL